MDPKSFWMTFKTESMCSNSVAVHVGAQSCGWVDAMGVDCVENNLASGSFVAFRVHLPLLFTGLSVIVDKLGDR